MKLCKECYDFYYKVVLHLHFTEWIDSTKDESMILVDDPSQCECITNCDAIDPRHLHVGFTKPM